MFYPLVCLQAAKPPDLNPETEESVPSQSSPKGPDPPILTEVGKQEEQPPLDLEGVKRKMDQGGYSSVVGLGTVSHLHFQDFCWGEEKIEAKIKYVVVWH